MDQSKVTVRYARALFSLAKEKNLLEAVHKDMSGIFNLCQNSDEFIFFLESPVVNISRKKALMKQLFGDKTNDFTLRFLFLTVENKREKALPGICRNFLQLARKEQGITLAEVTTSVKMSPETKENIRKHLEKETSLTVELHEKVDTSIIGGIVIRLDDIQFDASIATQLKKIKQSLLDKSLV